MRIFISADLEGVSGVVHSEQTSRDGKEHQRARQLMTGEVNAAIEGALHGGATEVVVNDSHGTMRNLIPEDLHAAAQLITGSPKQLSMMEGIDDTFNAVFFVGYHARMTSPGVLSHTYFGRVVYRLKLNGIEVGETGLNAAIAGHYNVPVVLVTGDNVVVQEAQSLLGPIQGVVVKTALTRYAARGLHPTRAREAISRGAGEALKIIGSIPPYRLVRPIEIELKFINSGMADVAELVPGVRRLDGVTTRFIADDMLEGFKAMRAQVYLAGTTL
ncbi:MAG: M55 family metallopeptidase [Firmicutes bacterium]|nr:M55 family metallopeptidase [Bacillota bacterium]MCL5038242.1 M55 family metallopeptidase [Bacillota bacterium]